jgi:hypothetical protein
MFDTKFEKQKKSGKRLIIPPPKDPRGPSGTGRRLTGGGEASRRGDEPEGMMRSFFQGRVQSLLRFVLVGTSIDEQ